MRAILSMGVLAIAAVGAAGCHQGGWTQWTGAGSNGHWYQIAAARTDWETGQWNDAPNAGTTGYDNGANDGPYASLLEANDEP